MHNVCFCNKRIYYNNNNIIIIIIITSSSADGDSRNVTNAWLISVILRLTLSLGLDLQIFYVIIILWFRRSISWMPIHSGQESVWFQSFISPSALRNISPIAFKWPVTSLLLESKA